ANAGDVIGFYENNPNGSTFNDCDRVNPSDNVTYNPIPDPPVGAKVPITGGAPGNSLNLAANLVQAAIQVDCSPSTRRIGQAATCTVTLTGQTHPTGPVSFASDSSGTFSSQSCTVVALGGRQARCSVTYTPTATGSGTHQISAVYLGDAKNPKSTSTTTLAVQALPSGVTDDCAPQAVPVFTATGCTATVTGMAPTGTVTFAANSYGTFSPATCTLSPTGPNQAGCSVEYTPTVIGTGEHRIYANYSGDANNTPSHGSTDVTVFTP
ncbi:MAG: hypothetical protein QOE44_1129, partial [Solirubrobacteraceae bacterium]|nr:hypothetical protein [Solirubrobacteraceae bacterium]